MRINVHIYKNKSIEPIKLLSSATLISKIVEQTLRRQF